MTDKSPHIQSHLPSPETSVSSGLLDHFAGRINSLSVEFGHEIGHLLQRQEGRPTRGPDAELEADVMGVRLAGADADLSAFDEICQIMQETYDDLTGNGAYPSISVRRAAMERALRDAPEVAPEVIPSPER